MQTSRRLAAVLALVALTVSLAETVMASMCAPMAGSPALAAVAAVAVAAQDAPHSADCPESQHGERSEQPASDHAHCPFSPVVTPGCVAAASLPTSSSVPAPPAVEGTVAEPTAAAAPDILLVAALFHPPRA